jgi:hypothetical protein
MNSNLTRTKVLISLALMLVSSGQANAGPIQAYFTGDAVGNQDFGGNLGLDFNVNAPITISALGAFDSAGTPFAPGVTVGIFQRLPGTADPSGDHTGALLASVTISGSTPISSGGYQFVPIAPLTLPSGFYSVVAVGFNNSNLDLNENFNDGSQIQTSSGSGLLTFVGSGRFDYNTTLDYPFFTTDQLGYNTSSHVFGGGSFLYTAATPEPASMTLLGFGIAGMAGYGWRRRKQTAAA